jgi:hypothetical protein
MAMFPPDWLRRPLSHAAALAAIGELAAVASTGAPRLENEFRIIVNYEIPGL